LIYTLWHNGLLLLTNNVGCNFFNVLQNIYSLCQSAIKIDNKHSDYFKIERGVKQGDSLRSCLFNYFVNDLHDIFDESCGPLKLENTVISSLTFADDLVIFSNSHKGLQNALNKLQKYCFDWPLTVNTNKSKILTFQKA